MSEKTVRDMILKKKKHRGLQARMFRAVVLICALLGLVLMIIGLTLYSMSQIQ